ncbi:hypothetical protein [Cohnella rhizosphaerae]|uniref:Uncharacterized protein n=1 Tax=Cohnella rhizosphaerae TaxID=1457232 RepID=A0A9X4KQK5_9BACL|nr:hypothetical protein [Cohnella rhizosphaerae]MDG0809070.1 hypothetical protein [Cohnella rhizosphaerae]
MAAVKLKRSGSFLFALVSLIFIIDTALIRTTSLSAEDPILVYAVLFDFMLVVPFLYWAIVLRPKGASIAKVAPLPIVGAAAAWVALPESLRGMVWHTIWPIEAALAAAEIAIIGFELRILYRFVRRFRLVARQEPDTGEALRMAVHEGIGRGKLANFLLHDLSMFYYLLFSWKRKRPSKDDASEARFTYHRNSSQTLYAAILTKIIVAEGLAMHLLLQQWSHWAAWIMTLADLWLLALIWADSRASFLRPVTLEADKLKLRYGLRIQADLPLSAIANAACSPEFHPDRTEQRDAATPLLSTPNVRIELSRPIQIQGLLFQPRTVKWIYLAVDEPSAFVQQLERAR